MKKLLLVLLLMILPVQAFAWENVVQSDPYKYAFSSTATTTTIKSSAGILHSITVTGGTSSPIDIYNGVVLTSALIYSFTSTNALNTYLLDVGFTSGCVVVTNGALKYTVSYK